MYNLERFWSNFDTQTVYINSRRTIDSMYVQKQFDRRERSNRTFIKSEIISVYVCTFLERVRSFGVRSAAERFGEQFNGKTGLPSSTHVEHMYKTRINLDGRPEKTRNTKRTRNRARFVWYHRRTVSVGETLREQ